MLNEGAAAMHPASNCESGLLAFISDYT